MPVSKLKNLAILILLLANAALLGLLIPRQAAQYRQAQELRTSLSQLCEDQNVRLDPDCVPDTIALYPLELADSMTAADTAAGKLLGEDISKAEMQNETTYTAASGTCTVHFGGSFQAKLLGQKDTSNFIRASKQLLKKLDFSCAQVEEPVRLRAGVYTVRVEQTVLGVPVFCRGLTLTYSNSVLTELDGEFLMGTLTRAADDVCISATDAVVCFLSQRVDLGWVGSAVTGLEQGYAHTEGSVRLTPVWKLSTDTGVFFVNGLTGEVSAAV